MAGLSIRNGQASREWPEAAAVGSRPIWACGVPAAVSFVLLEAKHSLPVGAADFCQGLLSTRGQGWAKTGSPASYGDRMAGLRDRPLLHPLFPAEPCHEQCHGHPQRATSRPTPLPWWCAVWGSVSPLLFPGTVEEWLHWFGVRTVLVPIASCLLLLVLVILLVRMER